MASQPFIGEIMVFGGNFAPNGWAFCDGRLMDIAQNDALFNLIGTTYGGDGITTFALPDLRGRVAVHQGQGTGLSSYTIGQMGGEEFVTLTSNQIPSHQHALFGSNSNATSNVSTNGLPAKPVLASGGSPIPSYATAAGATVAMASQAISTSGGSQPHDNMPPYLATNFVISLFGIFPSQN